MGVHRTYFDLIVTSDKSTEIRVNDRRRRMIREGSLIRFHREGNEVLTRVTRVGRYSSFEEMLDHEPIASINPLATREEQLANIRRSYPTEREAPRCRGHQHRARYSSPGPNWSVTR